MGSAVWAITGFKREKFDTAPEDNLRDKIGDESAVTTEITGQLSETTDTFMHGVAFVGHDKPPGYARLKVSLQKMGDFENTPIAARGLGAVSGGFITTTTILHTGRQDTKTAVNDQEWGVVDASKALSLCGFYNATLTKYHVVKVCFHRTDVASVSCFWRNGKAIIGPNIDCDKTDWGIKFKSKTDIGSHAISLVKGKLYGVTRILPDEKLLTLTMSDNTTVKLWLLVRDCQQQ